METHRNGVPNLNRDKLPNQSERRFICGRLSAVLTVNIYMKHNRLLLNVFPELLYCDYVKKTAFV